MNWRWLAVVAAGVALTGAFAAEPAFAAKAKKKMKVARSVCHDQIGGPTFRGIWFNTEPQPNGCSPAVHVNGRYIGQDPDPNIRFQLMRDPETGYTVTK
ncbi:hypothetical protein [Undibacter mobilis]|uniref:Uncharacterized protein n=1 Tax=Undibacter mobilis TaxID=2292256 RepID=A0A371B412_9BRAD|nr:hypothetical protein [Undibacter mobilis]RDV02319.1 hypothetical protein DXH78_17205 [Undibacter mobilis]